MITDDSRLYGAGQDESHSLSVPGSAFSSDSIGVGAKSDQIRGCQMPEIWFRRVRTTCARGGWLGVGRRGGVGAAGCGVDVSG